MNRRQPDEQVPLGWSQRILLIGLGGGVVALLVVAAVLEPDPRGYGTHQHFGLPPCTFLQLTGRRCPSCGMTTAWSHLVRGHMVQALGANAGGAALGVVALALAPWSLATGLWGRWWWRPLSERTAVGLALGLAAITVGDWMVRLWVGP